MKSPNALPMPYSRYQSITSCRLMVSSMGRSFYEQTVLEAFNMMGLTSVFADKIKNCLVL